ncbi:hypothetical protein [Aromatoleum sp.]|uniref:hypothetical protein n=1 Tax=Aromatoleum sp. TaxID=2307007 RepID=UPI002FC5B4A4
MALPRRAELFLVALATLPVAMPAPASGTIYCCEDANRRPICADTLPPACYGRAYREISSQGHVRRHVAAPLTPEEAAKRDAEAQRRKDEEARRLKQRRVDQALLQTYTSLTDIDNREARAVAEVERDIEPIRVREAELAAERRRLAETGGDPEAARPSATLQALDAELASLRTVVDVKQREIEAIRARFAADRRRYAELLANGEGRR